MLLYKYNARCFSGKKHALRGEWDLILLGDPVPPGHPQLAGDSLAPLTRRLILPARDAD
jgi:hypothetical protein